MEIQSESSTASRRSGLLVLGGIFGFSCLLLVIGLACFGSLAWYAGQKVAQATGTAQAVEQQATATVVARATEISQDGLLETFDSNVLGWITGHVDTYWTGEIDLRDGQYAWQVKTAEKGFLHYAMPGGLPVVADFDASVETRIFDGDFAACSGLLFRTHTAGWEYGGYAFSVCKGGQFFVGYLNGQGIWVKSSDWVASPAIKTGEWNHLEVSARGSHFIFKINDFVVYELEETSRVDGKLALFVEIHQPADQPQGALAKPGLALLKPGLALETMVPVTFLFDNFAFQNR